jgi:hypothetical protein
MGFGQNNGSWRAGALTTYWSDNSDIEWRAGPQTTSGMDRTGSCLVLTLQGQLSPGPGSSPLMRPYDKCDQVTRMRELLVNCAASSNSTV